MHIPAPLDGFDVFRKTPPEGCMRNILLALFYRAFSATARKVITDDNKSSIWIECWFLIEFSLFNMLTLFAPDVSISRRQIKATFYVPLGRQEELAEWKNNPRIDGSIRIKALVIPIRDSTRRLNGAEAKRGFYSFFLTAGDCAAFEPAKC